MTKRTYADPGDCVKCGAVDRLSPGDPPLHSLRWFDVRDTRHGTFGEEGELHAVCHRCGYEWQVIPKDKEKERA